MARRKGEISKSQLDRDWPFQVALPARLTEGSAYITVQMFAAKLPLAPAGHSFGHESEFGASLRRSAGVDGPGIADGAKLKSSI